MKLQDMRNPRHLKWPLYFMFGIVIISFVFFYGWRQSDADRNPDIFAKIRSENQINPLKRWTYIRRPQMTEAQMYLTNYIERTYIPQAHAQYFQQQGIYRGIMDRLITTDDTARQAADIILMQREARDMGVSVTREEIVKQFASIPNINDAALNMQARQMGMRNANEYIEYVRRMNELEQVRRIKQLAAQASLFELWQEYGLRNDKITLELAAFPNDAFTSKVLVTDQDAQKYYDEHRESYRVPTQRRYLYIKLMRDDIARKINPTEEQLNKFYAENSERYERGAAVKLNELQYNVPSGASRESAMQLMDDLRSSATASRDWKALAETLKTRYKLENLYARETDFLAEGTPERPARYMSHVMTLSNDTVSTPILMTQEDDGYTTCVVLARIIDRREKGVAPLAEVRDDVKRDFATQETDRVFKEKFTEWKAAKDKSKNMAELAKTLGVDDQITSMVDATEYRIPGVGTFQENSDYIGGLTEGALSDPIPSDDGNLIVLQPADTVEAHYPPLPEVRAKVVAAIQKERSGELARAAAQNALQVVQGGAKFDNALADAPVKPTTTEPQTRMDPVKVLKGAPLIDFQKSTLRAAKGSVGMSPYGNDRKNPDGYAVWRVVDYQPVSIEKFREDRQNFNREYVEVQQLAIVNEWLRDERAEQEFELQRDQEQTEGTSE